MSPKRLKRRKTANSDRISAILVLALWIGMIPVPGFFVSSVIFFTVMVWLIDRRKKSIVSIAIAFLVVCCIVSIFYFIFQEILLVPLPRGLLF